MLEFILESMPTVFLIIISLCLYEVLKSSVKSVVKAVKSYKLKIEKK